MACSIKAGSDCRTYAKVDQRLSQYFSAISLILIGTNIGVLISIGLELLKRMVK